MRYAAKILFSRFKSNPIAPLKPLLRVPTRSITTTSKEIPEKPQGLKWALLIAGSYDYEDYRHQADICHAYHMLKGRGVPEENIVVMMYDNIALHPSNPRRGTVINDSSAVDYYQGVPKDYTGEAVNSRNFLNVLLGNKQAVAGQGSGKVISSGPNDTIFLYYSNHGGLGCLYMPNPEDILTAEVFHAALKKKYEMNAYKSMLIYIEACNSGSMFCDFLKPGMNIYAMTSCEPFEIGHAYHIPEDGEDAPPPEYTVGVGNFFSSSWMDNCERYDMTVATVNWHYDKVRRRVLELGQPFYIHNVMRYGDITKLGNEPMSTFIGGLPGYGEMPSDCVARRDADLAFYLKKCQIAFEGSEPWQIYQNALQQRCDAGLDLIGEFLFGEKALSVMTVIRTGEQPLVDDWRCLRIMVDIYMDFCEPFSPSGKKYLHCIANMSNAGVEPEDFAKAAAYAYGVLRKIPLRLRVPLWSQKTC